MSAFTKATKSKAKLRLCFVGPSGSGKTYTGLTLARGLAGESGKVAVIDTERGSASKYADLFDFDVLEPQEFSPQSYIQAIRAAEQAGYAVLLIDSLTHAWSGKGGALEMVDNAARSSKSGNSYAAWRNVTPEHNRLVDAILGANLHVVATLRTKTEYVIETVQGKQVPRKVGMQPIQRDGMEYEFDLVCDLDLDHYCTVAKTRCAALDGKSFHKPGADLSDALTAWLSDGVDKPQTAYAPPQDAQPAQADEEARKERKRLYAAMKAFNLNADTLTQYRSRYGGKGATEMSLEELAEMVGIIAADLEAANNDTAKED